MTLTLNLRPELEVQLQQEAAKEGVAPEEFAVQTLEQRLQTARNQAAIELLRRWREEDATEDPAEREARQTEWEVFAAAMNENRAGERKLYP